jgi:hypothetical protein
MSSTTANSIHNYLGCVVDDIIEERQTKEDIIADQFPQVLDKQTIDTEENTAIKINETASIKTEYGTEVGTAKDVTAENVSSTTPEQGMMSALSSSLWTKMESLPAWGSSLWTKAESLATDLRTNGGSSLWTKAESLATDLRTNVESFIIRYKQPENSLLEDIKGHVTSLPALLSTACAQIDNKVENSIGISKNDEVMMPSVDRTTSYDATLKSENDTSLYSV